MSHKPTHWLDVVAELLTAKTGDLRKLATLAGKDPATFYLNVDAEKIDFEGQDVSGMQFSDGGVRALLAELAKERRLREEDAERYNTQATEIAATVRQLGASLTNDILMTFQSERLHRDERDQESAEQIATVRKSIEELNQSLAEIAGPSLSTLARIPVADVMRQLLPNPRFAILLDSYVTDLIRKATISLENEKLLSNAQPTNESFLERLKLYADAIRDLAIAGIMLARWANDDQLYLLENILSHVAGAKKLQAGYTLWVRLGWYPVAFLIYTAGISAISADRFSALHTILLTNIEPANGQSYGEKLIPIIVATMNNVVETSAQFKRLPGFESFYLPVSEYLFKEVKPVLEQVLLLGSRYDRFFDDLEIFIALTYADYRSQLSNIVGTPEWGPPGRFSWKESARFGDSDKAYSAFVANAKSLGQNWKPLAAGFFSGTIDRFSQVADAYAQLLARSNFF